MKTYRVMGIVLVVSLVCLGGTVRAANLIPNGDLTYGLTGWSSGGITWEGPTTTTSPDGPSASVTGLTWFYQPTFNTTPALIAGQNYRASFLGALLAPGSDPNNAILGVDITTASGAATRNITPMLDSTWRPYGLNFTATSADSANGGGYRVSFLSGYASQHGLSTTTDSRFGIDSVSLTPIAVAHIVNVDLNGISTGQSVGLTYSGVGAAGGGTYFNGVTVDDSAGTTAVSVTASGLKDSTNTNVTGITFAASPVGAWNEGAPTNTDTRALYRDYLRVPGSDASFTIGGLGSAVAADLYFYARQVNPATDENLILVSHGGTRSMVPSLLPGDANDTILEIADVPVIDGQITGTFKSGLGSLSGFTIVSYVAVPEPGTLTLLGFGLLGLLAYAWRKRK